MHWLCDTWKTIISKPQNAQIMGLCKADMHNLANHAYHCDTCRSMLEDNGFSLSRENPDRSHGFDLTTLTIDDIVDGTTLVLKILSTLTEESETEPKQFEEFLIEILKDDWADATENSPLHVFICAIPRIKIDPKYQLAITEALLMTAESQPISTHEDFCKAIIAVSKDEKFKGVVEFADSLGQNVLFIEVIRAEGPSLVERLRQRTEATRNPGD